MEHWDGQIAERKLLNTCNFIVFEVTLDLGFIQRVAMIEISLGELKHFQLCRFVEVNAEWTMLAFDTATRLRTAKDLTTSPAIFCI